MLLLLFLLIAFVTSDLISQLKLLPTIPNFRCNKKAITCFNACRYGAGETFLFFSSFGNMHGRLPRLNGAGRPAMVVDWWLF